MVEMVDDLMFALLVDDEGIEHDSNSAELRKRLKFSSPETDFGEFAATQHGYMEIRGTSRHCTILMNPVIALQATCTAMLDILTELAPDRVVLRWFDDKWHDEIFRPFHCAMERIAELSMTMPQSQPGDYRQARRSPQSLDMDDPLRDLFAMWDSGERDHKKYLAQLTGVLEGRYVLVRVNKKPLELTLQDVGPGFWLLDQSWLDRVQAAGDLLDQPDANYAARIKETFRTAVEGGEPLVHDVDTIINSPRDGRIRARYRRLMVPLEQSDGSSWLLSTSYLDDGIDLRAEV